MNKEGNELLRRENKLKWIQPRKKHAQNINSLQFVSRNHHVHYKHVFLSKTYQIKKGGKDQEPIQSSTTPDPRYHMVK